MIIHDFTRLLLYILAGVFPIWSDWFAKSSDMSFRGLAMPLLSSLSAAVMIALAILLAACAPIPKATPVHRSRVTVIPATKNCPYPYTVETLLPDSAMHSPHDTLYHEGQTIPGVPQVFVNGIQQ